jgi:MFS transporter, DHA2 family, multidrug resistance protein
VTSSIENTLTKSFSSAADAAKQYPAHAEQIIAGAKSAFLHGDEWAYAAGIIAVLIGAALVFFKFPDNQTEKRLLDEYKQAAQTTSATTTVATPAKTVA